MFGFIMSIKIPQSTVCVPSIGSAVAGVCTGVRLIVRVCVLAGAGCVLTHQPENKHYSTLHSLGIFPWNYSAMICDYVSTHTIVEENVTCSRHRQAMNYLFSCSFPFAFRLAVLLWSSSTELIVPIFSVALKIFSVSLLFKVDPYHYPDGSVIVSAG